MAKLNESIEQVDRKRELIILVMYHMTSYVTDVDFISDHFPAFWQAWLKIFLKLILQHALSSVILLFIKSQVMKTRVE